MESVGVLLMCPMYSYLEQELQSRFNLFKLWQQPPSEVPQFLKSNQRTIKAVVSNARVGVDAHLIDSLPNLEIVASFSVVFDKIDLRKCEQKGIRVTNTSDVLTDDVSDLGIALILGVLRKIGPCDGFVRSGKWKDGDFGLATKFTGKSVGIVCLGRIGSAIAKRAVAFGCSISYHSRSQKSFKHYKYYDGIIDLAKNCSILVVSCSLTDETCLIINREVIDALGSRGILINVGRGSHVDEPELVAALLDVYEDEPEVPEALLGLNNVVLLPHVGSDNVETCNAMADLVLANLEAHFSSRPLLTRVMTTCFEG